LAQFVGESRVAVPETTIHPMLVTGLMPACAVPVSVKVVEAPWLQFVRSGPAKAAGPMTKGGLTPRGAMKSTMVAVGDWDSLVLIRIVLTPIVSQGSNSVPMSFVMSTATSAKVLTW